MDKKVIIAISILFCCIILACTTNKKQRGNSKEDPIIWRKIKIDFNQLDGNGLFGPIGGKVAMNYEFCLPKAESLMKKAKKIDPSLQLSESKGRIGCSKSEWLCIGSTHQKEFKRVLYELAEMEEVRLIQQTFYE